MSNKNYYYVLVLTMEGPKFVTSLSGREMAHWDCEKEPRLFTRRYAEEVAYGLRLNGFNAFTVMHYNEIDYQPFAYDRGHFEWVVDKK